MEQEECAEEGDDPGPARELEFCQCNKATFVNHHAEIGFELRDAGPKVDTTSKRFRSETELRYRPQRS